MLLEILQRKNDIKMIFGINGLTLQILLFINDLKEKTFQNIDGLKNNQQIKKSIAIIFENIKR